MREIENQSWSNLFEVLKGALEDDWQYIDWSNVLDISTGKRSAFRKGPNRFIKLWRRLTLNWLCPKFVVLEPLGDPETLIRPGFVDSSGHYWVSSIQRKVSDGPYAMRIRPGTYKLFVAFDKKVSLKIVKQIKRESDEKIDLYSQ